MAYDIVQRTDLAWEERPGHEGQASRHTASVTDATKMEHSRARMWRYPAHVRGKRGIL